MPDDKAQLEDLLSKGYRIIGPVILLTKLAQTSVRNFIKTFNVSIKEKDLLDPANNNKTLIMLKHFTTNRQVELISSDEQVIIRAKTQQSYQNEPVGLNVSVFCLALGGRLSNQRIFHLDQLVKSLRGLWGWQFELGKSVGAFTATKRLEVIDKDIAKKEIYELKNLLLFFTYCFHVGFLMQRSFIAPILRQGPSFISIGGEEKMLSSITKENQDNIKDIFSSPEILRIIDGLRRSYIENEMPARFAMLWAIIEDTFGGSPKPLLSKEEIDILSKTADSINSLSEFPERLKTLKNALQNPDQLPLKSRNLRIAENIAPIMNITIEKAYDKVREASRLRGKSVHCASTDDNEELKPFEEFFQDVLLKYIERKLKGESESG